MTDQLRSFAEEVSRVALDVRLGFSFDPFPLAAY
jgi:hypothetical protein